MRKQTHGKQFIQKLLAAVGQSLRALSLNKQKKNPVSLAAQPIYNKYSYAVLFADFCKAFSHSFLKG